MRKNYETSKLYYGFPVILLGYKDANFKYNFTTNSSSYTLGDMMVIGFHSRSNAAKQIMNFKEFTVNVPGEDLMNEIEVGGFFHKVDKIPLSKLEYEIGEFIENEKLIKIEGEKKIEIRVKYTIFFLPFKISGLLAFILGIVIAFVIGGIY